MTREGVFDSSLISDPLLVCVFGSSFGTARKELDPVRPDLTASQTLTRTDFSRSLFFSNKKTDLLSNQKFPALSLSSHSLLEFPLYTLSKVEID